MNKIAVVNRTNLKNYGSVLQCYALCEAVKKLGYESEIVWVQGSVSRNYDFRLEKMLMTGLKIATHPSLAIEVLKSVREVQEKPIDEDKARKFDAFVQKHISQKLFTRKELPHIARGEDYKKFICGSDQVWCSTTMYVDPLMYLRFAPKQKRIAYAPSIGRSFIPSYNRSQMKRYISDIPAVSIREEEGKELIRDLTKRDVPVVLDPTLLLDQTDWGKLAYSDYMPKERYAVLYFLDEPSESNQKQIEKFLKNNGLTGYSIGQNISHVEGNTSIKNLICGPNDFLSLIKNAEVVISDSYHGILFSILHEKKFWSVEREYQQYDQSSRQKTILKKLGLESRYVKSCESISLQGINYRTVNQILNKLKEDSLSYLKSAIEA